MRARRIEVSQQRSIPLLKRLIRLLGITSLCIYEVCDDQLDCALRASVGIRRADGTMFRDGNHVWYARGIAVDGCGGGEDDIVYIVLLHAAQEGDSAADINAVVFERDLARLSNSLERSEVNDTVDVFMCGKHLVQLFFVCDIDLVELGALSAEKLDAVKGDFGRVVERVYDYYFVAMFEKS